MHPEESPVELNERVEVQLNAWKALGGTLPGELEQATHLLSKLDDNRFSSMKDNINNEVRWTKSYDKFPKTRAEVVHLACQWTVSKRSSSGGWVSMFAATTDKEENNKNKDKKEYAPKEVCE